MVGDPSQLPRASPAFSLPPHLHSLLPSLPLPPPLLYLPSTYLFGWDLVLASLHIGLPAHAHTTSHTPCPFLPLPHAHTHPKGYPTPPHPTSHPTLSLPFHPTPPSFLSHPHPLPTPTPWTFLFILPLPLLPHFTPHTHIAPPGLSCPPSSPSLPVCSTTSTTHTCTPFLRGSGETGSGDPATTWHASMQPLPFPHPTHPLPTPLCASSKRQALACRCLPAIPMPLCWVTVVYTCLPCCTLFCI